MSFIEIESLTKTIKGSTVLNNVTVSLEKNKIYGFVGENGSGKTMLFRAVAGLLQPTGGRVTVAGVDPCKKLPVKTGIMLENIGLWANLSAFDNLKLLNHFDAEKLPADEMRAVIRAVGLDPGDKKPFAKFSLGMKQKLAIAQALMGQPELLILDEPTNALDADSVALVHELLLQQKERGATILIASHRQEDISTLCDRVFTMHEGKLEVAV